MIRQMEETRIHTEFYENPMWPRSDGLGTTEKISERKTQELSSAISNWKGIPRKGELRVGSSRQASCNLRNLRSPSDVIQNADKLESIN